MKHEKIEINMVITSKRKGVARIKKSEAHREDVINIFGDAKFICKNQFKNYEVGQTIKTIWRISEHSSHLIHVIPIGFDTDEPEAIDTTPEFVSEAEEITRLPDPVAEAEEITHLPDPVVEADRRSEEVPSLLGAEEIERLEKEIETLSVNEELFEGGYVEHGGRTPYWLTDKASELLNSIDMIAKNEGVAHLLITGPSGYGKTTMAKAFAALTARSYFRQNCALIRDPEEWYGHRAAVDGTTIFEKSEFAKVLEAGNAVIVFDEFNRLEPWLANSLFSLLDDDHSTTVLGETFSVGPNVVFISTINLGYQYVGTFPTDVALIGRIDATFEVEPLPRMVEANFLTNFDLSTQVANAIATIMERLRSHSELFDDFSFDPSTRASIKIARLVATGMSIAKAFNYVVLTRVEDKRSIVDIINSELLENDEGNNR